MWQAQTVRLHDGRAIKFAITDDAESPLAYAETVRLWQENPTFCGWFNDLLAAIPFAAFRWETPAVVASTVNRTFEFVVLDSPELERTPDPAAFAEHISDSDRDVVEFANLGRDAVLIVPCPIAPPTSYGHLASFVRQANLTQRLALWQAVGSALARRIETKPVWLSTAGAGVPWLHVRLDDRPKYYAYRPYKAAP